MNRVSEINLEDLKKDIPEIFKKVKKDVKKVVNRHREGLSLSIAEMGMFHYGFIGGMHFHPGTEILMNKTPLKLILETQPSEIVWAYTYHVLLNMYLSSLGILNEKLRHDLTLKISKTVFKEESHPAVILARKGIEAYLPDLKVVYIPLEQKPEGSTIEYIYYDHYKDSEYYT